MFDPHLVRIERSSLVTVRDEFLGAAIEEALQGQSEGGVPIGSVLVTDGRILGRGHNRRVQKGSAILHGEMDAIENAGRQSAEVYRNSVLYTTLSPCAMCSGAVAKPCAAPRRNRTGAAHSSAFKQPLAQKIA